MSVTCRPGPGGRDRAASHADHSEPSPVKKAAELRACGHCPWPWPRGGATRKNSARAARSHAPGATLNTPLRIRAPAPLRARRRGAKKAARVRAGRPRLRVACSLSFDWEQFARTSALSQKPLFSARFLSLSLLSCLSRDHVANAPHAREPPSSAVAPGGAARTGGSNGRAAHAWCIWVWLLQSNDGRVGRLSGARSGKVLVGCRRVRVCGAAGHECGYHRCGPARAHDRAYRKLNAARVGPGNGK